LVLNISFYYLGSYQYQCKKEYEKLVLFALLALSVNAFAQIQRPAFDLSQSASHAMEKIREMMGVGATSPGTFFQKNQGQFFSQQPPEEPLKGQMMDSVYIWQWDTVSRDWAIESKIVEMA
jgi:hypothetical protein